MSRRRTYGRDDFLQDLDLMGFEREVPFHPTRKWRWDAAIATDEHGRPVRVAVEYHGFVGKSHGQGDVGHASIGGMLRDAEKVTEGQLLGWLVIVCNSKSVADGSAMDQVIRALESRGRKIA